MRLNITVLIVFICFFTGQLSSQTDIPYKVVDDLGIEFTFSSVPQKIVTLAPNLTEFIYVLGAGDKLAGNTTFCNYPEAAKNIEKIGDILTIDYEKLLTINPDLIFITVEGNTKSSYEKLNDFGFKVFTSNPRDYNGIKKTLLDMGRIFKLESTAQEIAADWDKRIQRVKDESQDSRDETLMFVVELTPLMLAGKNTFINQFIELCGLQNFAKDSPLNYPVYSREEVFKNQPDYIVFPLDSTVSLNDILNLYPEWKELKAVNENKLIYADRDLYFRPGPRFVDALENLFTHLSSFRNRAPRMKQ